MCVTAVIPAGRNKEALAPLAEVLKEAGVQNIVIAEVGSTSDAPQGTEGPGTAVVRPGGARSYAVREALMAVETPYVLVVDPEAEPTPQEIKQLLSRLRHYDVAVAVCPGAAQKIAYWLTRAIAGVRVENPAATTYAARTEVLREAALDAGGGDEAYWLIKAAASGARVTGVPFAGRCKTALPRAVKAALLAPSGAFIGAVALALGLLLGNWVAYRYFYWGIPHYTLGLISLALIILGGALLAESPLLSALRKAAARRGLPAECLPPYQPAPPRPKPPEEVSLIAKASQGLAAAFVVLLALGAYYLSVGDATTANKLAEWAYYALVGVVALALGEEIAHAYRKRKG